MRKYGAYLLVLFLVSIIGAFVFFFEQKSQDKNLLTPLPDFLSKKENPEVSSLDFWLPSLFGFFEDSNDVPNLSAKSALVFDLTKDEVIFEKNSREKLPMASLTKLMTAIVAIDHKRKDNRYLVYSENLVGENVMGLSEGEVMSLEDLLYGVFMYSGNDAAEVLAQNTLGRADFVATMNKKAQALGLNDTHFTNPTGLQGDGDQYTTAYDLLVISRYAVANYPEIIKVSSTAEHHIPETQDHYAYSLYNQLNLVTTYPGVRGLKDGYTPEAGLCLITYLDYNGHELIGIILGSENRRQEMKDLLDYSLKAQGIEPPKHD